MSTLIHFRLLFESYITRSTSDVDRINRIARCQRISIWIQERLVRQALE